MKQERVWKLKSMNGAKKDDWIRIGFGMILIVGHYWTGLTKCKDQYASKIMNPPSDTLLYGNKWRCTV